MQKLAAATFFMTALFEFGLGPVRIARHISADTGHIAQTRRGIEDIAHPFRQIRLVTGQLDKAALFHP